MSSYTCNVFKAESLGVRKPCFPPELRVCTRGDTRYADDPGRLHAGTRTQKVPSCRSRAAPTGIIKRTQKTESFQFDILLIKYVLTGHLTHARHSCKYVTNIHLFNHSKAMITKRDSSAYPLLLNLSLANIWEEAGIIIHPTLVNQTTNAKELLKGSSPKKSSLPIKRK